MAKRGEESEEGGDQETMGGGSFKKQGVETRVKSYRGAEWEKN